ncbi:hypothetical protein CPB83DRAFT_911350 [Crepidotus variabilis]|uniref:Uncharacterized protein n=1 Tax=Crepidotus variabilis TaxID=179855 RepID=A0A9P6JIY9_9AGAR|nr:hypothetical protein CPB83DRAFT_911350 [Crepidotus variabilis]
MSLVARVNIETFRATRFSQSWCRMLNQQTTFFSWIHTNKPQLDESASAWAYLRLAQFSSTSTRNHGARATQNMCWLASLDINDGWVTTANISSDYFFNRALTQLELVELGPGNLAWTHKHDEADSATWLEMPKQCGKLEAHDLSRRITTIPTFPSERTSSSSLPLTLSFHPSPGKARTKPDRSS